MMECIKLFIDVVMLIFNVLLVYGVKVAIYNYKENCRVNKENKAFVKIEKAVELAGYYKDNILELSNPLFYVYRNTGI